MITGSLAITALLCLPVSSPAVTTVLNVNSSLSTLTLSGGVFGLTYTEQLAGSLVDLWSGQITGDLTGGTWTFSGGSSLIALLNPVAPSGTFSTAPIPRSSYLPGGTDNYGGTATGIVGLYGLSTVNGAYRALTLDVTSGTTGNGLVPGGALAFTGGRLDWGAMTENYGPAGDSSDMTGKTGANTTASLVSWDDTTLTLPVAFQTTGANGLVENWTGTLVATVPEPSALVLGALGLVGFLAARNRRARGI